MLSGRDRGRILKWLAAFSVAAVLGLTIAGIVRSRDLQRDTALVAKVIGGTALLLVAVLRWRSIRRAVNTLFGQRRPSGTADPSDKRAGANAPLPASFRARGAKHFGAAGLVQRATFIEVTLLVLTLLATVLLMRQ